MRSIDVLDEVMERHEPGYERDPTKKIQLLTTWPGSSSPRVAPLVVPYLADMDEGVRYAAVEALLTPGGRGSGERAVARTSSCRIKRRACGSASGSPTASPSSAGRVGDKRAEVEKRLPDAFTDRGARQGPARIKKKPAPKPQQEENRKR